MDSSNHPAQVVLIVDDSPTNLELLCDLLDDVGYEVLVAQNGESAIEKVRYTKPDLILLDVLMPGIDGFETCRRLQNLPEAGDIPIIFMTALSDTANKVKGLNIGAVDYITKPFQQEEVLARIQLHLRMRTLHMSLQQEVQERTATEQALQQLTASLEQRIDERTADLRSALQELQQAHLDLLEREQKLHYQAFHDSLTSLPNRAWFMERLEQTIQRSIQDSNYVYAVLFVDIDRFKVVNDSLGHLVGDELLKQIASRLQTCLTDNVQLARFGGDEFIILLEDARDLDRARHLAETIQEELQLPFIVNGYKIYTGASIGITGSSMNYQQASDVLRDVDVAMYQAKVAGRGRYQILTYQMQQQVLSRLHLEHELRQAVESRDFCLHYQPIVALDTGELQGFEALIRWYHPQLGWVSPAELIAIAEETGLIGSLGEWVFYEACWQLRQWQKQFPNLPPLSMHINLSAIQLKQPGIVSRLLQLCQETGLDSQHIKLEITESSFLEAVNSSELLIHQLKKEGFHLCIDDFGTGYSSLSRLHEFPIDTLKIDRAFVNRLSGDSGIEIMRTIITLAHSLDMELVAEGIERTTQQEVLLSMACEFGQGYLFSPPVNSDTATQWFQNASPSIVFPVSVVR
jgi:diguanylate cyclase (GGDEF)-like protein